MFGLTQQVRNETHLKGHILDLVIGRDVDNLTTLCPWTENLVSDHFLVTFQLSIASPQLQKREIQYKSIKDIDISQISKDIAKSALYSSQTKDINEYAELYNITIFELMANMLQL